MSIFFLFSKSLSKKSAALTFLAIANAALPLPLQAGETNIAVAANFTAPAKEIAAAFAADTGHKAILSFGSTGTLSAQITNGAPFEIFLAADAARPKKAIERGDALAASHFTYAIGKLALFSTDPALIDREGNILKRPAAFAKIAIANPKTAPYGRAAMEVLKKMGLSQSTEPKLVRGNNISQTYQFVATGNVDIGFVALSQIQKNTDGSTWIIPRHLYNPINQDAVLLTRGANNPAATAFLNYLKSDKARAMIEKYGYGTSRP